MNTKKFINLFIPEHKTNIMIVLILKIMITIIPFLFPLYLKIIIDNGILTKNLRTLLIVSSIFFLTVIIRQVILIFTYRFETRVSTGVVYSIRKKITENLLSRSISYFEKSEIGDLLTVINNDSEKVESFAINTFYQIVLNSLSLMIALFLMFFVSWKLSLLCLIPVIMFPIIRSVHSNSIKNLSQIERTTLSKITELFQQSFSNIYLVLSFNLKPYIINNINQYSNELAKCKIKKDTYHGLIGLYVEAILEISTTIIVYCVGGYLVIKKQIGLGSLMAFGYYLSMSINPIGFLYKIKSTLANVNASFDRITIILEEKPEIIDSPHAVNISFGNDDIAFKNVSFSYNESNPLIENFTYTLHAGKMHAICGDSGSGKSTLIKLLLRFHDLNNGEIVIGEHNIKHYSLNSLRSYFSIVPQEAFYFNKSIWENFQIVKPDLTQTELDKYIEMVGLKTKFDSLENAYDTIMGERGILFSGGEKQRLSIARALLRNSSVIILDEATSQLDGYNEKLIIDLLKKINQITGKTIIMVAHRISTICEFDEIVVLENCSLVESGSHEELLAKKGKYYQMWNQTKNNKVEEKQ